MAVCSRAPRVECRRAIRAQLAEVWDREQARILRERFEQLLESRRVQ